MIWSLQLTTWALPPLLAVLLVARDQGYLWARRREHAVRPLAVLAAVSGLWAIVHLVTIVSPGLSIIPVLLRLEGIGAAAAPVAWLWFALSYARREKDLLWWPTWILYVVSAVTVVLAIYPSGFGLMLSSAHLAETHGLLGLRVSHGPWFWVETGVGLAAVVAGTVVVVGHARLTADAGARSVFGALAGLVVVGAIVAHLGWSSAAGWKDMTPVGFAVAATLLGSGLLHRRLLTVGPVARTLVMVQLQDPIVVFDGRGRIVDANHAAEQVLGLRPYGDVPVSLGTLWAKSRSEAPAPARIRLEAVGEGEVEERDFEVTVTWLDERGAPGRAALVLRDVTPLLRAQEELEKLAGTDVLTGLANRRRFMATLAREIERASRYRHPLSLVLMDIDHFKDVNDAHGHAAGDEVLRHTSGILREVCRDVDLAARIGGEELVLLLPETDAAGARSTAERVRQSIEAAALRSPTGEPFRVTASLGVASYGEGADTPDRLLQASDDALYRAKTTGRNRVVVER